jgi:hypothetical protein
VLTGSMTWIAWFAVMFAVAVVILIAVFHVKHRNRILAMRRIGYSAEMQGFGRVHE